MKTILILCLFQRICCNPDTFKYVSVDYTTITKVIIYGTISEIYRTFNSKLTLGYNSIVLRGLPASLDEKSIKLSSIDGIQMLGMSYHDVIELRKENKEYNSILSELIELSGILNGLILERNLKYENTEKRLQNLNKYVESVVSSNTAGQLKNIVTTESITAAFDFQNKFSEILLPNLTKFKSEIKSIEEDLATIQESIKRLSLEGIFDPIKINNRDKLCSSETTETCKWDNLFKEGSHRWPASNITKEVTLYIHVSSKHKDASYEFIISYMTNPAQWTAEYDIYLLGDMDTNTGLYNVTVEYYASIDQSTEEDWTEIELSLSTSLPTRAIQPYSPRDKTIYFQQVYVNQAVGMEANRMKTSAHGEGSQSRSYAKSSLQQEVLFDGHVSGANIVAQGDLGMTYFFTLPYPVTVKSNRAAVSSPSSATYSNEGLGATQFVKSNRKHRLLITALPFAVRLFSYVVPSVSTQVFLRATSRHTDSVPLLSCDNARLFLQASYTGNTQMPFTTPGEQLRLNFGAYKKTTVRVHRDVPQFKGQDAEASSWFTFEKKRYRIKREEQTFHLSNLNEDKASLLLVHETLPKSTEEDIKMDLETPKADSVIVLKDMNGADLCLNAVLSQPFITQAHIPSTRTSATQEVSSSGSIISHPVAVQVYGCGSVNDLIWAVWLGPGQQHQISLKYKILWPEDKQIYIS